MHPLDSRYASLQTNLTPVARDGATHRFLASYMTQTHAPTHNGYTLELLEAFEV